MPECSNRFFVITGGPGAGKSTLVDALKAAGFRTSGEAGRQIIRDQTAISGRALPWLDPELFAEMMLALDMQAHHFAHANGPGRVFFDRGVPDIIGYLRLVGAPVPPHASKAAGLYRYDRRVFVCPPWPEIFTQDRERLQTPDEAERTHASLTRVYAELGYELVEVPRAPVDARVRFILRSAA